MRQLIREHDWSATPLGPASTWPQALQLVVSMCLGSPAISAVYWGPEFRLLYNDAYAPFLAERHPWALGRPMSEVWPEMWHGLAPQAEAVIATGRGFVIDNQPLVMSRDGRLQETFWSYSFSPIPGDGTTAGIYLTAVEMTGQVMADRQLAAETARQRQLFERAPGFIAILQGPEHVFEFTNEAYLRLVGKREIIGLSARDALPEVREQGFFELLDGVFATGERYIADHVPIRLQRSSGAVQECFVNFIYEPIRDDAGEITGIFVEGHDVTQTHHAQAALRESEEFNRRVLASSNDCIKVLDLDGKLTFMSEGGQRVMEVSDFNAIRGCPWPDFWQEPGNRDAKAAVEAARAGRSGHFQGPASTMAGTPKYWDVQVTPIFDADGKPERILSISRDITETRRAEDALRSLNDTLEQQVEKRTRERDRAWKNSRDLQVVVEANGIIRAANEAWTTILGWQSDEVIGRSHLDFNHPDEHQGTNEALAIASTDVLPVYESRLLHKDGSYRWISWVTAPEDGLVYASGRHVTAEKSAAATLAAAQEQLRQAQKLEAVGQLTGGVAHDFNNLLTVIKSSTDLLKRPGLSEDRRDRYIGAISDTVERAAKLTGQLLAFARRQALRPEVFDAGQSVKAIGEMVGTLTGARIMVSINVGDEPCHISADPSQFDTALVNMAVNARDAMDGEGRLYISVEAVGRMPAIRLHPPQLGDFVKLALTDTGSGIPADQLDRIFEPFFTTKGVGQGTGLGLSQVFGFAKQSGGEVMVESELGRGTTFALYLPRAEKSIGKIEDPTPVDTVVDGRGICVLVVEDNREVGSFSTQTLEELGYGTHWVANADEALATLAEKPDSYDVVFSDVVMPGMNGVELGREIRRLYPGLPVVLTSGYSHVLAQDSDHGFELLQKPYSVEQLSRVLSKAARLQRRGRIQG
ncbi:hybrid sensor histidine kinase/response regulator [Methylobacterium crusticola]|uniref:hybrid sensor histidine kinase/response regulator n=1 Tax=Methylobacterium crusticola TaxID=1697972 RepID=UPI0019399F7C|nr:PAS domain-containing protein [Methylobacterium crusticola]